MPRRVNNLFKRHKAKLVPAVGLGGAAPVVDVAQCTLQRRARQAARTDLAYGNGEGPPLERWSTLQKGEKHSKVRTVASFICFAVPNPGLFAVLH